MPTGATANHPLGDDLQHILQQVGGLAEDFRGARLFITGGTGFFGKWLLESFVWMVDRLGMNNAHATVLTRDPIAFRARMPALAAHPALDFITGDVRSFAFPEGRFDYVIHAATEASAVLNVEQPLLMLDTIVEGTRHVLDFAERSGVRRFLLTSSGAVYGRQPSDLTHVPETYVGAPDPLAPNAAYGEGKRVAEALCAVYSRRCGFDAIIARCWAFVGPYLPLDGSFAIGNFIRDALAGDTIQVGGDGTPYRSYLYGADLAVWLWTLLLRGDSCRAYNVGSDEARTIGDLARLVAACSALPRPVSVEFARTPIPGAVAERYAPDVARAATELGLTVEIGLEEAIARTIQWLRSEKISL